MALSYGKIHMREQHCPRWPGQGWTFLVIHEIFTPGPRPSHWVENLPLNLSAFHFPADTGSANQGFHLCPTDQEKFHLTILWPFFTVPGQKTCSESHCSDSQKNFPFLRTTFTFPFSEQLLSHFSYFLAYRGSASVSGPRLPPNCEKSFEFNLNLRFFVTFSMFEFKIWLF